MSQSTYYLEYGSHVALLHAVVHTCSRPIHLIVVIMKKLYLAALLAVLTPLSANNFSLKRAGQLGEGSFSSSQAKTCILTGLSNGFGKKLAGTLPWCNTYQRVVGEAHKVFLSRTKLPTLQHINIHNTQRSLSSSGSY